MPMFMTQFKYTADAWHHLVQAPTDRSLLLGQLMEKLGGRMLSMHYCLGEYDGVITYEAPDAKAAGALLLATFSAGHMRALETTQLFTTAEAMEMMAQAATVSFRPPES